MKKTDSISVKSTGKNKNKYFLSEHILRCVGDTLDFYGMLTGIKGIVVAFSGGADSTALLDILSKFSKRCAGFKLCAFHVNHGIRGSEADADENHCKKFCEERGIEFSSVRINVPEKAEESGMGIEEKARCMRYDSLVFYCAEHGYDCIATAHHADDNLETLLFRIARGTGIKGLCGIPPVRYERGIRIIRPLIRLCRREIEEYLAERNLTYVTDSTNYDVNYSRNRIRELVIPELRKINPSLHVSTTRLTEHMTDVFSALTDFSGGDISDGSRQREFFGPIEEYRSFAESHLGYMPMLENVHIRALRKLEENKKLWSSVSLPGNIFAVWTREGIEWQIKKRDVCNSETRELSSSTAGKTARCVLYRGWNFWECKRRNDVVMLSLILLGYKKNCEDPVNDVCAHFGSDVFLNGEKMSAENTFISNLQDDISAKIKKGIINIYKLSIHAKVNSVKLNGSIFVRHRADGDRIKHNNMTKRVKKLLQEKKLSPDERDILPFVCDDDGIVWIPGVALRDGICAETDGDNTMYLSCLGHWSVDDISLNSL